MYKIDWNQGWTFYPKGEKEKKEVVNLPHDAMIHRQRVKRLKNGSYTGFYPSGDYVYEKTIYGGEDYRDKTLLLELEGAYMDSSVFLNGAKIGGHVYGYSNYYVDLTEGLRIGENNEIRVETHASQVPNARWYPGNGLYRPVWLYVGEKTHVQPDGVVITTEATEPPTIRIRTSLSTTDNIGDTQICVTILDGDHVMAKAEGADVTVALPEASLWSAENPVLYEALIDVACGEKIIDETSQIFGIRSLDWSAEKGLRVNGQEVKLRGGCVHHDNGILGACDFEAASYRKVRIMKEAGFNAIRAAHNPISKSMLRACDELGMYIMEEAFDTWRDDNGLYGYTMDFEEQWRDDLAKMIVKDRNHPSVVMYSIGNEISDTAREDGIALAEEMTMLCHDLDATRPVTVCPNLFMNMLSTMGQNFSLGDGKKLSKEDVTDPMLEAEDSEMGGSAAINVLMMTGPFLMKALLKPKRSDKGCAGAYSKVDIAGYNYGEAVYEGHHDMYPQRIMVGSETHPPTIVRNWSLVKKHPYLIGDFMWTGWDYLGEVGVGVIDYGKNTGVYVKPYPAVSAYTGVINLIGDRELYSHLAAMVWGEETAPFIAVQPLNHAGEKKHTSHYRFTDAVNSWTWNGYEGKKTVVEVYSPAEIVELFINGKSLGRKPTKDFVAVYKVTYEPGTIEAVNVNASGEASKKSHLTTAAPRCQLMVKADKIHLCADGQDLAFLYISMEDSDGNLEFLSDAKVTVSVNGAGVLQGFGTGNPKPEESYTGTEAVLYQGKALAVIRAGCQTGKINITVSAEGYESRQVDLLVE